MRPTKALAEPETRQGLLIAAAVWAASLPVFMAPTLGAPRAAPWWAWAAMALVSLTGLAAAPFLLWVVRATEARRRRLVRFGAIIAAVTLVALLHAALDLAYHEAARAWFDPTSRGLMFVNPNGSATPAPVLYYVLMNFIILVWVHAGVAALGALSRFNWVIRRHELAAANARAAADKARLATIRMQLSPHFLFNTLNAISSLVLTGRSRDAETMLGRLSDFFRASLGRGETEQVSVASELAALGAYLDIEELRYDGHLSVRVDCDESLYDAMLPTFLLQPLAEQAVEYAVGQPGRDAVVRVTASDADAGRLRLTVSSRSAADTAQERPALDLRPVAARLAAVYGDAAEVRDLSDAAGFAVEAVLPLNTPETDGRHS